jgi:hypothetical protein
MGEPMFGGYDIPLKISNKEFSLSFEKKGEGVFYKREFLNEKVEKIIDSSDGQVFINPVEPLYLPKKITANLLVEFPNPVTISPKGSLRVFVKFPIEIGIFMMKHKKMELLDVLTLRRQKFSLYGSASFGVICKYYKSEVYSELPTVNPLHEGVIELGISNKSNTWNDLTKAVFNAYGMKIYYSKDLVSMKASLTILDEGIAETSFINSPFEKGMSKSLELYVAKKLRYTETKFLMEAGL